MQKMRCLLTVVVIGFAVGAAVEGRAQPTCRTTLDCAQAATASAAEAQGAVASLTSRLDTLQTRVQNLQARIDNQVQVGSAKGAGENRWYPANVANLRSLSCPGGTVATGIRLWTGGTCHNQCGPDGTAISGAELLCSPVSILKMSVKPGTDVSSH